MEYSPLTPILTDPIGVDALEQGTWAMWEELTSKYNLHRTMATVDVRATIRSMTQGNIKTPADLSNITKNQPNALGNALFAQGDVSLMRQCDKCHLEYPVGRVTKRFHSDPEALAKLLSKI